LRAANAISNPDQSGRLGIYSSKMLPIIINSAAPVQAQVIK
jgi:hypothetical protein